MRIHRFSSKATLVILVSLFAFYLITSPPHLIHHLGKEADICAISTVASTAFVGTLTEALLSIELPPSSADDIFLNLPLQILLFIPLSIRSPPFSS
ncbi:MAG: hypothetical protein HY731_02560 [Candidatus Tectomicrobia bacterium]|nr:hypothetical protein [Candidatus Tectomicrobia bacterium]